MELLGTFCDEALQSDYNLWESIDVHGYQKNRGDLEKFNKTAEVASDVKSSSSLSEPAFVSKKLPEPRRHPAERTRIDIGKTHHSGMADMLADKLRSKLKTSDAESS